jgi:hypothetical protein
MNSGERGSSPDVPGCFEVVVIFKMVCKTESKVKQNKCAGRVEHMVKTNAYGVVMGKQEGRRLSGKPRNR